MTKLTKFSSMFLTFVILVCTFQTALLVLKAETIKVAFVNGSGVYVRQDATTKSDSVDKVSYINTVILGEKEDTQGVINTKTEKVFVWYNVKYTTSSKTVTGYIREDLLEIFSVEIDEAFEKKLSAFPKSYHEQLKFLHALYPEWEFVADELTITFSKAVALQDQNQRKQIYYKKGDNNSRLSMAKGTYDWSEGKYIVTNAGYAQASTEVIKFYMDPRNFLNDSEIYIYLKQQYDSKTQTKAELKKLVEGTFLEGTYTDKNDLDYANSKGKTSYVDVIMAAAKKSSVSPLILASTIIQEQGVDSSTLSNGKAKYDDKTVYNFFNYGASGDTADNVIKNGSKYAYEQGWFTRSASIIGGAVKYGQNYIKVGQDTYFYKNYNVINPDKTNHQYAQNVADSLSSSKKLRDAYSKRRDVKLTFRIPVYKSSLPSSVCKLPVESEKKNNYYFSDIKVDGLTPSFYRYTYEYSLSVEGDTSVYVKISNGATITNNMSFSLEKGVNQVKLTVKSETGYKKNYYINVEALDACELTITTDKNSIPSTQAKVVVGDTNGDGKVSLTDLARVRLNLLGSLNLTGNNALGADTNNDGKISLTDLARIRLHLVGSIKLK